MSMIQKYIEFGKLKRSLCRDKKKKRKAISSEVSVDELGSKKACVQTMDFFCVGFDFSQIEVGYCDIFCENAYCQDEYCHMVHKNRKYINSVNVYKTLQKAQWDLIRNRNK